MHINKTEIARTHSQSAGVGNMTIKNKNIEPVGDTTFWQKCRNQHMHQIIVELCLWRVPMVGKGSVD
jgi:hypothetical protein